MIQLYKETKLPSLTESWQDTYILSRFLAYGTQENFAPFFTDEEGNFLSLLDGNGVISGISTNVEEWGAFLSMHTDVRTVAADISVAEKLASVLQRNVIKKKVMQLQNPLLKPDIPLMEPTPRQMYPLLLEAFGKGMPAFDGWYVDVSHRIRHGVCQTVGVERDGKLVPTAMTVAQSDKAIIIGSVATASTHRKQGLASQCLRKLATQNVQKKIMISPKTSNAEKLYTALGFTVCGEIGQIELEG